MTQVHLGIAMMVGSVWMAYALRYRVDFTTEQRSAIKQAVRARRTYRRQVRANDKEIVRLERSLAYMSHPKGDLIAEDGGIIVWSKWIKTPESEGSIMGVRAKVAGASSDQASGSLFAGLFSENKSSTAPATAAGDFQAHIVVNGNGFAGVGVLRGGDVRKVEKNAAELADTINATARSAEAFIPRQPEYIERFTQELEVRRNGGGELLTARNAYIECMAEVPASIRHKFGL